jgi:hypothetical protein
METIKNYSTEKWMRVFVEEKKFVVPLDYFINLRSEEMKLKYFLKTQFTLNQLFYMEERTAYVRPAISRQTADRLAFSVLAITNAFFEAIHKKDKGNSSTSNDASFSDDESSNVIFNSDEYKEFRLYRMIKSDFIPETEDYEKALEFLEYPERAIIYRYLLEMWKNANQIESTSTTSAVSESLLKYSTNKQPANRMAAYTQHMQSSAKARKFSMTEVI